ncbi:MAG: helicase-exonuclease AddAB subunit AddA [Veillonella sp.]|uniref:helicase-exonuclease AddAB subunit AddA n=1 Tax=Veillonella sp. TaxID=1926307 RepID=UPI0029013880|nr:helicase-exonuclease AddAB subunit AddA [Veillonella sp.]MDU1341587.1 helicase-exonuclease AddAB subunit AddA [Veillonella sp.]MDU1415954.1 helicase-exonuclease AddAB subunit AddA [Veillonella sp.]MDU2333880.1 helicase-exonuclease AddAB subunit AddA [Veillonella sp.]MDU2346535.1 helicase-exonuclease AddAB subunit AddA [Veillonella sp.]MDU5245651.1 helicase-exonuclease AddAB subunit AddA [Veillonella sp.]
MGVKWTPEQESAIMSPKDSNLGAQTLLVAAAAGSGKTAVLVERIITRLKDMENPLSVQELMVVTFTKAAAAEMSARIGVALAKAMESTDDKALQARLERQLNLLPSAHISTLHSFCQWVIRSYFYKLDIPPTARIGNEAEMALLKQEVLENLLKEAYEHNEYGIFDLSDFFSDDKSDAGLQDKVLSLYEFAMSQSNPDGWMRHAVEPYKAAQEQDLRDTLWGRAMWDDQQAEIDRIADRIEQMEPLLESPVGPKKWDKVYQEQLAALAQLKGAQTWSDMVDVCRNLDTFTKANFTSLSKALEKGEVDGALADEFKSLGSQNKDSLKGMKNGLFHIDESVLQQQFKDQYPLIHNLVELTIAFHKAYDEAKKEQGIMDFSDLEHLCLALLVEPGTEDDPQPSEVALELQDTFKEIMVDEYQDTNGVQETIINLISRVDNRFYVGDVKQAIYSFRMADSSLFMNKYNTYGLMNDAVERRIDLAKNFRSHENILTTTNFIFYQIMTQEAAELDYGEKESLIPGRIVEDAPSDWVGGAVELHLLDTSDTNRSDETEGDSETAGDEPENNERELDFIIQKIKELHASKKQVQNADGSFRQIQWRDFAVLRRSLAGWGTRAVAAMRQAGIPAVVNERDGYFEAQEIQLLLSLLQIIDNPEQDLPMAAVLHSGLVGLDANELGALRLTGDGSLWSVMPLYAEQAQDEHLLQFIAHIERWRTLSRRHGVADLLWDIYETLDYVNYVGAMPNGLVRRANVMALYERAKGFESSGFRGLFRFLRFVESLRDSNQDMAVANVVTEADDVVRLMTIHKSKGLEFPVVFLSGVQKKFNTMDFNSPLLVDKNGGIGLKGYYPDIRVSYPSMPWLYCKSIKSDAMKAEEQRILYVALTRARDKLFLTGYINKEIKKEKGVGAHIKHAALTQTQALGADLIKAGNSYLHWLLIAFARHLDGGASLRNIIELEGETNFDLLDRQCQVKVEIHDGSLYGDLDYKADVDETTINTVRVLGKVNDVALPEEIVQRFAFTYPNLVAAKTTAKISVSELKRRFAERDAEAVSATDVSMQQKPVISCNITEDTTGENAILDTSIPTINETELADSVFGRKPLAIAAADEVVTGAQWGTLMHEAMQWLPVKKYTQKSMTDMLDLLQAEGKFSDEERSLLSDRSLYGFFNSDLGHRLIASKRVERELPFSMLFDGNRVYPDVENGERLFLQGIIDTVFVEDDQWVLVDYKTDRIKSGDELIRRYKIQMDLYKEALERLTNMPVKASYIYSFRLHEAVLL